MKRTGFLLGCVVCALAFFAAGCGSDSDSGGSGADYNVSGSAETMKIGTGETIRNKVVNLGGSADVYYEYLTFTSESCGTYAVYKDSDEVKTKIEKITLDGNEIVLPSKFEYDSTSGGFRPAGAEANTAYMLNAKKDGKDVCVVASEILETGGENKESLFNEWKSVSDGKYIFQDGGYVLTDKGGFHYTNSAGWILVSGSVPFYWAKTNGKSSLYYMAHTTEREVVEAEGKAALAANGKFLVSERFFLVR